jgi:hypothetical protein
VHPGANEPIVYFKVAFDQYLPGISSDARQNQMMVKYASRANHQKKKCSTTGSSGLAAFHPATGNKAIPWKFFGVRDD